MLTLREYQEDTLARIAEAESRGINRQLVVAATGLGKTVMFTGLAQRRGGRVLILAHRDELIAQAVAKVVEVYPELAVTAAAAQALSSLGRADLVHRTHAGSASESVGIVKASANDIRARVVVASVQTLSRPKRIEQLVSAVHGSSLLQQVAPFDIVITDEAHHSTADSYGAIYDALRVGRPACTCNDGMVERMATPEEVDSGCELGIAFDPCPNCYGTGPLPAGPLHVGFTATPDRGDGAGLASRFDEVVASYDMLWGIRSGYLSDLRGKAIAIEAFKETDLRTRRGDYDQGQAGRLLEASGAHQLIVRGWQAEAADRKRTLVFTPTVDFAVQVTDAFLAAGISAGHVSGSTPLEERQATLQAFHRGELSVLTNCAVLTEGYDEPQVDCIVVARPTKSRALYTQIVGRGTRRHPDKADCLILDVVGATAEHSLITIPSLFGIDKKHRERNGDGTMSELVAEHEAEEVAAGRLRAEEVALFAEIRSEGIAWVPVHTEGELRRYVRPLPDGKPTVVLAQRDENLWTAGLLAADGTKQVLMANVAQELAQGVAEDYARKHGGKLTASDADWRRRRPSPKQRGYAKSLGIKVDKDWTAGDVSDAIDRAKARRRNT